MQASNALTRILSDLSVPRDRIVYIHSSMDWLSRAGIQIGEAIEALVGWTGGRGGTLVLPSFPFRGSHEAYLRTDPVFDVRRSPARVGLLNETLRRRHGVMRSLDPDLSVIALGAEAERVVGSGFTGPDPTGPDSPFQRVIGLGGVLLGLGVSFNYMNMIHVLDSRYRDRYTIRIYAETVYRARTIDREGRVHAVAKHAMLNELQIYIKPSRILPALRPGRDVFRSLKMGETDFFLWELPGFERLCVGHIERMLDAGELPCWLAEVARRVAARAAAVR